MSIEDRPDRSRRNLLNTRIAAVALTALALIAPTAASAHPSAHAAGSVTLVPAKSCSSGYVRGTIGGVVKCLRAGEYCSVRYKQQYLRYGFTCSGNPARLHHR
jgi:hypothetical protein